MGERCSLTHEHKRPRNSRTCPSLPIAPHKRRSGAADQRKGVAATHCCSRGCSPPGRTTGPAPSNCSCAGRSRRTPRARAARQRSRSSAHKTEHPRSCSDGSAPHPRREVAGAPIWFTWAERDGEASRSVTCVSCRDCLRVGWVTHARRPTRAVAGVVEAGTCRRRAAASTACGTLRNTPRACGTRWVQPGTMRTSAAAPSTALPAK